MHCKFFSFAYERLLYPPRFRHFSEWRLTQNGGRYMTSQGITSLWLFINIKNRKHFSVTLPELASFSFLVINIRYMFICLSVSR